MSDPVRELVKAHLKQLRLPAMARELERLSREAAASDMNYEQFLLRLAEAELAASVLRIITPAFVHRLTFCTLATCATTWPSPLSG